MPSKKGGSRVIAFVPGKRKGTYRLIYEGGTMVPAIVRWPKGIKPVGESDVLMSQIDWMASLGALIGARFPQGSAPDSQNRLGNLLGTDSTGRPWVVEQSANHVLSIRTGDWKYIEANDGPAMVTWGAKCETGNSSTPQLYGLNAGLYEQDNVALQHPDLVFEFETLLRQLRTSAAAR